MPEIEVPFNNHRLDITHINNLQVVLKQMEDSVDTFQTHFALELRRDNDAVRRVKRSDD